MTKRSQRQKSGVRCSDVCAVAGAGREEPHRNPAREAVSRRGTGRRQRSGRLRNGASPGASFRRSSFWNSGNGRRAWKRASGDGQGVEVEALGSRASRRSLELEPTARDWMASALLPWALWAPARSYQISGDSAFG